MRTVIQRVSSAEVTAGAMITGKIGKGLLVLVGFEESDGPDDIGWLSGKIVNLRIFPDEQGVMNRSVETDLGKPVSAGIFGAMMEVSLINDGPVTIVMDTKSRE